MADDLRAPLPRSFERLADDLVVGRHGDPHVAFAVLVYPDRAPAVVAITARQSGAHDLSALRVSKDDAQEEQPDGKGRFFTLADLDDATHAMTDAERGFRTYGWREDKADVTLGLHLVEEIANGWRRRRENRLDQEMKKAAHEAKYAFRCEICGSGYTERGLKMHQQRAVYCSRRLAERAMDSAKEATDAPE